MGGDTTTPSNWEHRLDRRKGLTLIASAIAAALLPGRRFDSAAAQSIYLQGHGMPYDAYEALPKTKLTVAKSTIAVAFAPGAIALSRPAVFAWIEAAAQAVTTYYGHFPVPFLKLLIVPVAGGGVRAGTTWGYRGAAIRMQLGEDANVEDLRRDWMMTHECVHLALPDVAQNHVWLAEGLAVYIEPIARVQSGELTAPAIWKDMIRSMPNGLPESDDEGLDNTPTWGRIYWGGALFCLLADLEIRRKTDNRLGLQDAMRGVLAAGGTHEVEWPIRKIFGAADRAVGLTVLSDQYDRMRATRVAPDLPKLWRDLGIDIVDDTIRFRDDAPLAAARDAITRKPAG
jgi:hypothetical protein